MAIFLGALVPAAAFNRNGQPQRYPLRCHVRLFDSSSSKMPPPPSGNSNPARPWTRRATSSLPTGAKRILSPADLPGGGRATITLEVRLCRSSGPGSGPSQQIGGLLAGDYSTCETRMGDQQRCCRITQPQHTSSRSILIGSSRELGAVQK